jgi:hypothetical protein
MSKAIRQVDLNERRYSEEEVIELGLLGCKNRITLHRRRKAGLLGYYRVGGRVYYGQGHIEKYLAHCERNATGKGDANAK